VAYLPARFALARFAIANADLDTAKKQLDELSTLTKNESDDSILNSLNEQYVVAVQAKANGESLPPLVLKKSEDVLQAAQLLEQEGDATASMKLLESWVKGRPQDIKARMALAQAYTRLDRNDDALAEYAVVLESNPGYTIALNNAAWLLRDSNPENALVSIRKAVDLAPEDARIRLTAAKIELQNGDKALAKKHLETIAGSGSSGAYQKAKNEAKELLNSID